MNPKAWFAGNVNMDYYNPIKVLFVQVEMSWDKGLCCCTQGAQGEIALENTMTADANIRDLRGRNMP